jgi:hypothetical protein
MKAITKPKEPFALIFVLAVLAVTSRAQEGTTPEWTVPLNIVTNKGTLPTDYVEKPPPVIPPSPAPRKDSPAPSVNFQGLDDNNTSAPPGYGRLRWAKSRRNDAEHTSSRPGPCWQYNQHDFAIELVANSNC